jgi:hypothetical protein
VRSDPVLPMIALSIFVALAFVGIGIPGAWAAGSPVTLPTTHTRKIIAIPPNDPNDHHVPEDLARAGMLRHSPKLPPGCWVKTSRGQKYIQAPPGPDVCAGNTVQLWIGEEYFHFLRCHGRRCETLETFRPNAAAAVGEQTLSYWSTQLLKEPRIVLWQPSGG